MTPPNRIQRRSGQNAGVALPFRNVGSTAYPASARLPALTGNSRRLAEADGDKGDGTPSDAPSASPSTDPFCSPDSAAPAADPFPASGGTAQGADDASTPVPVHTPYTTPALRTTSSPNDHVSHASAAAAGSASSLTIQEVLEGTASPSNASEEAVLMRLLADKVLETTSLLSAVLPHFHHGSNPVRAASQKLAEAWAELLTQAERVEKGGSDGEASTGTLAREALFSSDRTAPRDGVATAEGERTAFASGATGGLLEPPHTKHVPFGKLRKPLSQAMPTSGSRPILLQTISETDILDDDVNASSWLNSRASLFGTRHTDTKAVDNPGLEEALELAGFDTGPSWSPFGSHFADPSSLWRQSAARGGPCSSSTDAADGPSPRTLPELYSAVAGRAPRSASAPPIRTGVGATSGVKTTQRGQAPAPAGRQTASVSRGPPRGGHAALTRTFSVDRRPAGHVPRWDRSVSRDRRGGAISRAYGDAAGRPGAKTFPVSRQTTQRGTDTTSQKAGTQKGEGQSPLSKDRGEAGASGHPQGGGSVAGAGGSGRRPGGGDDKKPRPPPDGGAAGTTKRGKKEKKKEEKRTAETPVTGTTEGPAGKEQPQPSAPMDTGKKGKAQGKGTKGEEAASRAGATGAGEKEDRAKPVAVESPAGVESHLHSGGDDSPPTAGFPTSAGSRTSTMVQTATGTEDEQTEAAPSETAKHPPSEKPHGTPGKGKGKKKAAAKPSGAGKGLGVPPHSPLPEAETSATQDAPGEAKQASGSSAEEKAGDGPEEKPGDGPEQAPLAGAPLPEAQDEQESPADERTSAGAAGGPVPSDGLAELEAIRMGARPKARHAAPTKGSGRQKKKAAKEATPPAAEAPQLPHEREEEPEEPTRGRARRRAQRSSGDSRRESKGQRVPASSAADVRGREEAGEAKVLAPAGGFHALAQNIEAKLAAIVEEHEQNKQDYDGRPGIAAFVGASFRERDVEPSDMVNQFDPLCEAAMADIHALTRMEALLLVAKKMRETEAAAEKSAGFSAGAGATGGEAGRGEESGVPPTPLAAVTEKISNAMTAIQKRTVAMSMSIAVSRYRFILSRFQPPPPALSFPSERSSTEVGLPEDKSTLADLDLPSARDPFFMLRLLKEQLGDWTRSFLAVKQHLEKKWWTPPSDPEEAERERQRTALAFELAGETAAVSFWKQAASKWKLREAALAETDPARKESLERAAEMLKVIIETCRLKRIQAFESYGLSLWATAVSRLKKHEGRWMTPPDRAHCPEVRAAMEAAYAPPSTEAGATSSE
ncbi:hypothetical protein NCLIV_011350 [Neospora caninum Liverpool]|uniref:Toxoplasma gondii family E protein n=1 Tax=Neospora caninum (strain Liverpool) TaxID=572307 RepID=F0VAI0_NEOCL|nr:hypothetical protein NCLIV_011350 [Neospora caninum Liverpool]CBZ50669.1 hypothetical protein NCLIV_011350 [Neospora caninum Liverpool]|eukprot:XP_003880702.1 hypothetical protein NCLIV_011350 [Neospora caninum Liverpool]